MSRKKRWGCGKQRGGGSGGRGQSPPPNPLLQVRDLFVIYDTDHSGTLSLDEIVEAMADTTLNYDDLRKVVSEADEDGNAELDVEEVRTRVSQFARTSLAMFSLASSYLGHVPGATSLEILA